MPLENCDALFTTPKKCCSLYDKSEYTCILHPAAPPKAYFDKELRGAHRNLTRAYAVDLLVLALPIRKAYAALLQERRGLGLEELPEEWHFSGHQVPTFHAKRGAPRLGKLCLRHRAARESAQGDFGRKDCFLCRANGLRDAAVDGGGRLYEEYKAKYYAAVRDANERAGGELYGMPPPPPEDPGREWSADGRFRVRVTDWAENARGEEGNYHGRARRRAETHRERKEEVWLRMSEEPRPWKPKSAYREEQPLGTVKEEEEE
jgi:hypothetical protein